MGKQCPKLNDFVRPCPPIALNHGNLVSCYCLFYVKEHSVDDFEVNAQKIETQNIFCYENSHT